MHLIGRQDCNICNAGRNKAFHDENKRTRVLFLFTALLRARSAG